MAEQVSDSRRTVRFGDGIAINYEVEGDGATPVVFLHGFAASLITWHDIRPFFPRDRFLLYFLDLKGFGSSAKPRDGRYAPEDHAAVVTSLLEGLGLRHVTLVGHSLGGGIALLTFLRSQAAGSRELIDRLILISCAAYPQPLPPIMRLLRNRLLGRAILHLLPVRFMVRYTLEHVFRNRQAITPERVARYATCFSGKEVAHVFISTCRQLDPARYAAVTESFRTIAVPTLIIWGKDDPLVDVGHGIRLHREIAGSRLTLIDGCGHVPQEERPAETFAAIEEFLEGS